jgi:hypothetical protein
MPKRAFRKVGVITRGSIGIGLAKRSGLWRKAPTFL